MIKVIQSGIRVCSADKNEAVNRGLLSESGVYLDVGFLKGFCREASRRGLLFRSYSSQKKFRVVLSAHGTFPSTYELPALLTPVL